MDEISAGSFNDWTYEEIKDKHPDEYENRKIQWDYIGAFPTGLSEIEWNYNNTEEIGASATFEFIFS